MSLKVKQKYAWGTETSLSRSLSKSAFFSCEEGVFSQEKWDNWNHGPYMELCNMVARTKRQRRKRCLLFMTFFGKIAITGSNVLFKTLIISILHEIACGTEWTQSWESFGKSWLATRFTQAVSKLSFSVPRLDLWIANPFADIAVALRTARPSYPLLWCSHPKGLGIPALAVLSDQGGHCVPLERADVEWGWQTLFERYKRH